MALPPTEPVNLDFPVCAKAERMAKHTGKGRGKMGRYIKGNVDEQLSLGTLAAKTGVKDTGDDTVINKTWLSSVKATYSVSDLTLGANDGPIAIYLAHSDYSLAEIEEYIENTGSWDAGDLVSQEVSRRKIRYVGSFGTNLDATSFSEVLNDGKPIHTKCGWYLEAGHTLVICYYNAGTSALGTTVATAQVSGHANLWPR